MGHTTTMGMWGRDDFDRAFNSPATWNQTTLTTASTLAVVTPVSQYEWGVQQCTTSAVGAGRGTILNRNTIATCEWATIPPPGTIWTAKLNLQGTPGACTFWSGFVGALTIANVATATPFVGIRCLGSGSNLFGIVKDAAGEVTVDLGVSCEGGVFRTAGFEVGGTYAAPTIQFFLYDCSNVATRQRLNVGVPQTTHVPAVPTTGCAMGVVTGGAYSVISQIDFWEIAGRAPR